MPEERVEVQVQGVFACDEYPSQYRVVLRETGGRQLSVWVGALEAMSIFYAVEDQVPDRPNTHDAMLTCLTATGAAVEEAYINDLRDETYYALLRLRVNGRVEEIDVRPSDALSLAVRAKCPIYIRADISEHFAQAEAWP